MPKHEPEVLRAREINGALADGMRLGEWAITPEEAAQLAELSRYLDAGGRFPAGYLASIRRRGA